MPFELSPNRLCLLRKQHGLSQKQLAALVGQDRTMISMYERGRILPTLPSAGMFQVLFGLSVADIFPELFKQLEQGLEANRQKVGRYLIGRQQPQ
jgi:transcriptional regulator with XRE-family HTH domain